MSGLVYGFHMPLFFMLSGAVMALKDDKDFDSFISSKIKRLVIPYFVCGLGFMLPVKYLGGFYTSENFVPVVKSFLNGGESGHLWFLMSLFWCMAIFSVLRRVFLKIGIRSVYAILLAVGWGVAILQDSIPDGIMGLRSGMGGIFWFALGYAFECRRKYHPAWSTRRVIFALTALIFAGAGAMIFRPVNKNITILIGCVSSYLLAVLCARTFPKIAGYALWRVLVRNSFAIYLFHDPLEYVVLRVFMSGDLMTSSAGCIAYLLSRTLGVFVVSILLGEVIFLCGRKIYAC